MADRQAAGDVGRRGDRDPGPATDAGNPQRSITPGMCTARKATWKPQARSCPRRARTAGRAARRQSVATGPLGRRGRLRAGRCSSGPAAARSKPTTQLRAAPRQPKRSITSCVPGPSTQLSERHTGTDQAGREAARAGVDAAIDFAEQQRGSAQRTGCDRGSNQRQRHGDRRRLERNDRRRKRERDAATTITRAAPTRSASAPSAGWEKPASAVRQRKTRLSEASPSPVLPFSGDTNRPCAERSPLADRHQQCSDRVTRQAAAFMAQAAARSRSGAQRVRSTRPMHLGRERARLAASEPDVAQRGVAQRLEHAARGRQAPLGGRSRQASTCSPRRTRSRRKSYQRRGDDEVVRHGLSFAR